MERLYHCLARCRCSKTQVRTLMHTLQADQGYPWRSQKFVPRQVMVPNSSFLAPISNLVKLAGFLAEWLCVLSRIEAQTTSLSGLRGLLALGEDDEAGEIPACPKNEGSICRESR